MQLVSQPSRGRPRCGVERVAITCQVIDRMLSRESRIAAYLAFAAICIIWGTTFAAIRVAIETFPTLLVAGVRFLIAGIPSRYNPRMNRLQCLALALVLLVTSAYAQTDAVAARIDRILREVPLIDGHNDLAEQYEDRVKDHLAQIDIRQDQSKLAPPLMTDIPRLRQGRVGRQFWSVYVPATLKGADAVRATLD